VEDVTRDTQRNGVVWQGVWFLSPWGRQSKNAALAVTFLLCSSSVGVERLASTKRAAPRLRAIVQSQSRRIGLQLKIRAG
jgi:hypothetical protein